MTRIAELAPGLALDIRSPPKNLAEPFERGNIDLLVMPEQYVARLKRPHVRLFKDTQVHGVVRPRGIGKTMSFEQ